tara:strand:- start:3190 stop:3618 length:429 start_codon:yes stop_codon:yes gene_type:complete
MDKDNKSNNNDDVVLYFADSILSKCSGSFDDVNSAMIDHIHHYPDELWMLESYIEMKHRFGSCVFTLHFYNDKSVCIYDYRIRRPNASNLADVQFLKKALSNLGWNKLYPYHSEVDKGLDFWKSLWETGIVEYEKFENMYSR